jgi:hypothetical protein
MWTILRVSNPLLYKTKKHLQTALSAFQKNSAFVADAFIFSRNLAATAEAFTPWGEGGA